MSYMSEDGLTPGVIDGAAEHAFSQASLLERLEAQAIVPKR
jgi:hypothetical protein